MFGFDLNQYMIDMVYELVPGVKRNGDKLNFKCPICGDSHKRRALKRGWFYIKTGSVFCWNAGCPCNNGMSGLQFLALVSGKSIYEIKTELIKRAGSFSTAVVSTAQSINLFDDLTEKKKTKLSVNEHLLDADWTDQLPELASKVITSRKIDKAPYLNGLKFYYNKHSKRLVIPWSDTYWQERALLKVQEETEGKYLFPFDENAKKPIFGLNSADLTGKNIFLLEGVFDSVFVKGGLAVGSLKLSNYQNELLEPYKANHTIVYFMDNQWADKSSYDESLKILKEKPFQKIFIWPKALSKFKDVNDTIICSDKFIQIWQSETWLNSRIFNGINGIFELKK
jgi:ssDNA-binding Zn-finger/Zn-ribbon topoisomerase 1